MKIIFLGLGRGNYILEECFFVVFFRETVNLIWKGIKREKCKKKKEEVKIKKYIHKEKG